MLPRLVIRQDFGALTIESKPAQMAPRQTQMRMTTNTKAPSFTGGGNLARVQIDQTEAFASAGLKPVLRMANDNSNAALQQGIQTIGRIASEGLQFLQIESGSNPVPQISRQRMMADSDVRITVASMPSAAPQIDMVGGEFELNWSPSSLNVEWEQVSASQGTFTPGEINIAWLKRPHIEISVEQGTDFIFPNIGVGNNLDAAT